MHTLESTLTILGFVTLTSACGELGSGDDTISSRQGDYSVHSVVDGGAVESEIYRGDVLVAIASVDDDAATVTLVDGGLEVVSTAAPQLDDLAQYQSSLADVSEALELQSQAEEFRLAGECGFAEFTGGLGQLCIASWCSGTSCHAIDCAPGPTGCGESHYIAPECSIV